jgi:hypothetical protein
VVICFAVGVITWRDTVVTDCGREIADCVAAVIGLGDVIFISFCRILFICEADLGVVFVCDDTLSALYPGVVDIIFVCIGISPDCQYLVSGEIV